MKKILLISNSSWNIINFRINLIDKLIINCHKVIVSTPYDNFTKYFNKNKYDYIPYTYKRKSFNIFENLKIIFFYLKVILKQKPDIMLLYTIKPNILISISSIISNRKIKIYNFITGLGSFYFANNFKKKLIFFLYKIAFIKSEKIIFQNIDDLNVFISNKIISKNKALLIPGSGVDTSFFKFNQIKNKKSSHLNFLCISRIIFQKGIIEYLEAAKMIKKEFPNISFSLVGSIDLDNISSLNLNKILSYKKYVKYSKFTSNIYELLNECDCFVLPSYREGTSKSILEAASVGIPIITTNVPGCNNIVQDNQNGYLCKPRDIISLYECLKKMINTTFQKRNEMSIKSRKIIEKSFDIEIINNQILHELNLNKNVN